MSGSRCVGEERLDDCTFCGASGKNKLGYRGNAEVNCMSWLKDLFGKGERPSDGDQALAGELARELAANVFSPPPEGELELSGDTAADAAPLFRYMHAKGREVADRFLAGKPAMSERL